MSPPLFLRTKVRDIVDKSIRSRNQWRSLRDALGHLPSHLAICHAFAKGVGGMCHVVREGSSKNF